MKKLIALLSLFFFINCAGMHKKYDTAIFEDYVTRFEDYSELYGTKRVVVTDLIIEFGDLKDTFVGLCGKFEGESPRITVDSEWWNSSTTNDAQREILMFHELGHCILDRDHNDNVLPNGKQESIMYYRVINSNDYVTSRGYYLKELFNGRQNPIERNDTCN